LSYSVGFRAFTLYKY